jgi:hypothetical protein
LKYHPKCFKDWLTDPHSVTTFSKTSFLDHNKDESFEDETLINGLIKQIYSEFISYKSLNVPPPFLIKDGVFGLLNYPGENFVLYKFNDDNYSIEQYLDASLKSKFVSSIDFKRRYQNIFKISDLICKLTTNNSRAFEVFCQEILKEQGFDVTVTPKGKDKGLDIYGFIKTFDKKRESVQAVELHPFIYQIASKLNYEPLSSTLKVIVQCKQKKQGSLLSTEDIIGVEGKFEMNEKSIDKEINKKTGKSDDTTELWEYLKILMVSTDLNKGARKYKNRGSLLVRVGIQLAWDLIWLSLMKDESDFDKYFNHTSGEFNEESFLKSYNE